VLQVQGDVDGLVAKCRSVLRQQWRPIEVLAVGEAERVRQLPEMPGLLPLVAAAGNECDAASLGELCGEYVLDGDRVPGATGAAAAEPAPGTATELVALLEAQTSRDEVVHASGLRLRRNPPALETPAVLPLFDAEHLDPAGRRPIEGRRAFALRFGEDDPDLPYRFRSWLADEHVFACAASAATAGRLALLSPRSVREGDPARALQRLAARAAAKRTDVRPARPGRPRHVVLQADDFMEGGLEQVVIDLAEALATEGFTTSLLILGRQGSAAGRARDRGLRVDVLRPESAAYDAYLEQCGASLVNAHYSTFGAEACALRGIPFVQTVHNTYVWFGPAQIDAYRIADASTAAYVCVSNNAARYADLRIGLSPSHMLVIPNGCDASFRPRADHRSAASALRAELGLPENARVFLNVASIQPPKGQHLLLGALARIAAEHAEAHVVFVGGVADAAYDEQQRAATERLGLRDRVHWVGRRSDIHNFHQLAIALVQPSFFEGWSLAITEAVLAELPVIATDVGGAVEQLRGTDGILVPAVVPDVTALDGHTLVPALEGSYPAFEEILAAAMRRMLERGGARSRLPARWPALLRDTAYRHCAEVFHWLAGGGSAAAARRWLWPSALDAASDPADCADGAGVAP
jgi:glycosyltransferase involved in cell wall biosynthesis